MPVLASCLGFPRIGAARELKKALESYWSGKSSHSVLTAAASVLRVRHWTIMKDAGIEIFPLGDFSLYDHMLDHMLMVGAIPERYQAIADPHQRYFAMARGMQLPEQGVDVAALEMTKWFDTNYHYLVPELERGQGFQLDPSRLLGEIEEARRAGIEPRPVILGPLTFLLLAKPAPGTGQSPLALLDELLAIYEKLLGALAERGVGWVQLDEPGLVLDLDESTRDAYHGAFSRLSCMSRRPRVLLTPYFGRLGPNLELATQSGLDGLHLDLARAPEELDRALELLPSSMLLSAGVVDGRNVWRTDLDAAHALVRKAVRALGEERVLAAPSCSLLHVPIDLEAETELDPALKSWLAFAAQKLVELSARASSAPSDTAQGPVFEQARAALADRNGSPRTKNAAVRARLAALGEDALRRAEPYAARARAQRERLSLPLLPTTTIGSFPQTKDVRAARAAFRSGRSSAEEYRAFLRAETARCIQDQERIGLDVLVHGEFERSDMVEYFGEKLDGFAFTKNGWVQSYGSRCVKPPILFGDVSRPAAMTLDWAQYAQSLSEKPVKGMLTGPVTILEWSFVRDDQPRSATCRQIALALRDEVADLEAAGLCIIQVDEPAFREGLPLRRGNWQEYLRWAVDAFRLATSGARGETQIHSHMCYSEFGDVLPAIAEMDADVLSIETSRSKMELLSDFAHYRYPNEIGPGVYDIHSPRIPTVEEMVELLQRARAVVPAERLWVNPDCGLKTRGWTEVEEALKRMVEAANQVRTALRIHGAE